MISQLMIGSAGTWSYACRLTRAANLLTAAYDLSRVLNGLQAFAMPFVRQMGRSADAKWHGSTLLSTLCGAVLQWMQDDKTTIVLTPQYFHNFNPKADIWNHK